MGDESLTILEGIGLEVKPGQSVALVGASGSGKSTLLGLLAGLDSATEGDIEISGQSLSALDEEQRARLRGHHIGFVFQSFLLLPTLTALENVMLPAELQGRSDGEQRARELLEQVGLKARLRHFPSQLSGGEQQRVAIARAIAKRPTVLFCDEPTGALDSHTGRVVLRALQDVNRQLNTTVLIVTHAAATAAMAHRVIHFADGRIREVVTQDQQLDAEAIEW